MTLLSSGMKYGAAMVIPLCFQVVVTAKDQSDHPDRIVRIDGDADIDAVFGAILAAVEAQFGEIG